LKQKFASRPSCSLLVRERYARGANPLMPRLMVERLPSEAVIPFDALAAAPFPKLVVSGGHSAGFDAICDDLAERIGAARAVVEGAGHEIQFAGAPINDTLLAHWRTTR